MSRIPFDTFRRLFLKGAVAVAVGLGGIPAFAQDKPDVIRIGSTAPGHLKFILAKQDGWWDKEFAKDGIKVELVTFKGGSEATTALATGAIEFAYTGNNPALRVAASGADVKLIGLSSYVRAGGSYIVVKTDSPLKTLQDLKGKKVAYLTGTVRHSNFSKALDSVGLTTNDVESLNLPFEALHDEHTLAWDVTGRGHWGNGNVEVGLDENSDFTYIMGLVRQAYEYQIAD